MNEKGGMDSGMEMTSGPLLVGEETRSWAVAGFLLFAGPTGVDSATAQYIASTRPPAAAPRDQLTNHGWILGPVGSISWAAQTDIDLLLEPAR